jgi:hypothetical protein
MESVILENVWKFIFILSVMGFLWFLNKYTSKIEKSIEKLTDGFNTMAGIQKLHDHRISQLEEADRVVKYRK